MQETRFVYNKAIRKVLRTSNRGSILQTTIRRIKPETLEKEHQHVLQTGQVKVNKLAIML